MKIRNAVLSLTAAALVLTGCGGDPFSSAADRANENIDKAAENFEVPRRIVGINTRFPDTPLFSVEGFCSVEKVDGVYYATCLLDRETGETTRTSLGLSNDVTFVNVQTGGIEVDLFRPRVIFRPEALVPNFDLSTKANPTEK